MYSKRAAWCIFFGGGWGEKNLFFFDILSLPTDAHFVVLEMYLTLLKKNLVRADWALDYWQMEDQMDWVYCTACPILAATGTCKPPEHIYPVTAMDFINQ